MTLDALPHEPTNPEHGLAEDPDLTDPRTPVVRRLATPAALALTVLSGVAYGISFAPLALRPLAWIALVPFLVAIRLGSLRRALLLGTVWACVMTFVTSDCLPGAVINYYKQPALVGWLILLAATVVTMVPWYSAFAAAYWLLSRRFCTALPALAAAAWVAAELARVTALGGNPWAVSGYSQSGVLVVMQLADVFGVHGVGFLLVGVNAALAEAALAYGASPGHRARALRGVAAIATIAVAVLAYGVVRLSSFRVDDLPPPVDIAIAQGNLEIGRQWRRDLYGRNLDDYLRLTYEAMQAGSPKLVFWPESALTFFLLDEPSYQRAIGRVLGQRGVQLIVGGPRAAAPDSSAESYFNATFLVAPDGSVLAWQDKLKLLPFAEYFPLEGIDLLRRDFGQARQFTPGEPRPPLPSVAGRAGIIVCNEAMYPALARERVAAGSEFLVNPANDSWFGALKYSLQAFDIATWRAVEQRRYLVRTSTSGPSGVIDPLGRVVVATAPFSHGWIAGAIRPSHVTTIYHRIGDAFAVACVLVSLAACGVALRPRAGSSIRR